MSFNHSKFASALLLSHCSDAPPSTSIYLLRSSMLVNFIDIVCILCCNTKLTKALILLSFPFVCLSFVVSIYFSYTVSADIFISWDVWANNISHKRTDCGQMFLWSTFLFCRIRYTTVVFLFQNLSVVHFTFQWSWHIWTTTMCSSFSYSLFPAIIVSTYMAA